MGKTKRPIDRLLDALLGPKCEHGCGHRVYPRDRGWHHAAHESKEITQ